MRSTAVLHVTTWSYLYPTRDLYTLLNKSVTPGVVDLSTAKAQVKHEGRNSLPVTSHAAYILLFAKFRRKQLIAAFVRQLLLEYGD